LDSIKLRIRIKSSRKKQPPGIYLPNLKCLGLKGEGKGLVWGWKGWKEYPDNDKLEGELMEKGRLRLKFGRMLDHIVHSRWRKCRFYKECKLYEPESCNLEVGGGRVCSPRRFVIRLC